MSLSQTLEQARQESEQIERLMRAILRLFADERLVYRERRTARPPVEAAVERVVRLRVAAEVAELVERRRQPWDRRARA